MSREKIDNGRRIVQNLVSDNAKMAGGLSITLGALGLLGVIVASKYLASISGDKIDHNEEVFANNLMVLITLRVFSDSPFVEALLQKLGLDNKDVSFIIDQTLYNNSGSVKVPQVSGSKYHEKEIIGLCAGMVALGFMLAGFSKIIEVPARIPDPEAPSIPLRDRMKMSVLNVTSSVLNSAGDASFAVGTVGGVTAGALYYLEQNTPSSVAASRPFEVPSVHFEYNNISIGDGLGLDVGGRVLSGQFQVSGGVSSHEVAEDTRKSLLLLLTCIPAILIPVAQVYKLSARYCDRWAARIEARSNNDRVNYATPDRIFSDNNERRGVLPLSGSSSFAGRLTSCFTRNQDGGGASIN